MSPEAPRGESREITPAALGRQLLHTYYHSFAVGQSNDPLQERSLTLAGYYYHGLYGRELLSEAIDTVSPRIDGLRLPHNHLDQPADKIRYQFTRHWKYFCGPLIWPGRAYDPAQPETQSRLADVIGMTISTDRDFMKDVIYNRETEQYEAYAGRHVGSSGRDPRQSFTRDHILGGATVGDDVLDMILTHSRELLTGDRALTPPAHWQLNNNIYPESLPMLITAWQVHHPGQDFINAEAYANTPLAQLE
jgi:hypothetical protein